MAKVKTAELSFTQTMHKAKHFLSNTLSRLNKVFQITCALFIGILPIFAGNILFDEQSWYQGRYINYFQIRLTLHFIVACIVIGLWAYKKVSEKNLKAPIVGFGIIVALLIYNMLIAQSQGILLTKLHLASTWNLFEFLVFWAAVGIALTHILQEKSTQRILIPIIVSNLLFQVAVASAQLIEQGPAFSSFLTAFGQPPRFESFTYVGIHIFPRVYGTTPHPNILAAIMTFFAGIGLFLSTSRLQKIVITLLSGFIVVGTLSRTGIMAFSIVIAIFLLQKLSFRYLQKANWLKKPLILTVALLLFYVLSGIMIAFLPHEAVPLPYFLESRAMLQDAYVRFMVQFPHIWVFGTGFLGSIPLLFQQYDTLPFSLLLENSFLFDVPHHFGTLLHNELGIIGCTSIFILIARWFSRNFAEHAENKNLTLFLAVLLGIFLLFGTFDHFLIY